MNDDVKQYIKDHYQHMSDKEIGKHFAMDRSAIQSMRVRMGIKRSSNEVGALITQAKLHSAKHMMNRKYIAEHWREDTDRSISNALQVGSKYVSELRRAMGFRKVRGSGGRWQPFDEMQ